MRAFAMRRVSVRRSDRRPDGERAAVGEHELPRRTGIL